MRSEIEKLIELGKLPNSSSVDIDRLEKQQQLISCLVLPATNDEACAAINLLGDDECFGLAWSLLHFIESAPGWPIDMCLQDIENVWVIRLRERAYNAGLLPRSGG